MKLRIVVCCALVALVAVVPTASARPQHVTRVQTSQSVAEGVVTAVAAEIVKSGIKAGIAQWAPQYTQYVDPVGADLAAIKAQLAEISNKLSTLISHQQHLEAKLNCEVQRSSLDFVLTDAQAWFGDLLRVPGQSLEDRSKTFESLWNDRNKMTSDALLLHTKLSGADRLITSCAQHIENGLKPYLGAALAQNVRDFYAMYKTAAVELLVARVDVMAVFPGRFGPNEAQSIASTLERDWAAEESYIKAAVPTFVTYDKNNGWIYRTAVIPAGDSAEVKKMQDLGFRVSGTTTSMTCSGILSFVRGSGLTGQSALDFLKKMGYFNAPSDAWILCFDDHDRIHDFNLASGQYRYAGDYTSTFPSVSAKPNLDNGYQIHVPHYSYLSG